MAGIQAVDLIASYRRILIAGEPEQITAMLDDVEARLRQKGFERDPVTEKYMNSSLPRNKVLCFVGGPEGGPRLMLGLNRVSDHRVRGGTYSLLDNSPGVSSLHVADVVDDVIRNVIIPSASRFGLKVTQPGLGPNSVVQPRTLAALLAFCDVAAGEGLPFAPESEGAWRRFLITTFREDIAFDVGDLTDWFVANGWSLENARALTDRFIREATLLAEFSESVGA